MDYLLDFGAIPDFKCDEWVALMAKKTNKIYGYEMSKKPKKSTFIPLTHAEMNAAYAQQAAFPTHAKSAEQAKHDLAQFKPLGPAIAAELAKRTNITVSLPTEMALAIKKLWEEGNAAFHAECAAIGLRFEADPIDGDASDASDAADGVDGFIDYFNELEEQSKELIKLKEISSDEYLKKQAEQAEQMEFKPVSTAVYDKMTLQQKDDYLKQFISPVELTAKTKKKEKPTGKWVNENSKKSYWLPGDDEYPSVVITAGHNETIEINKDNWDLPPGKAPVSFSPIPFSWDPDPIRNELENYSKEAESPKLEYPAGLPTTEQLNKLKDMGYKGSQPKSYMEAELFIKNVDVINKLNNKEGVNPIFNPSEKMGELDMSGYEWNKGEPSISSHNPNWDEKDNGFGLLPLTTSNKIDFNKLVSTKVSMSSGVPPTQKQLDYLKVLNWFGDVPSTKKAASKIIDELVTAKKEAVLAEKANSIIGGGISPGTVDVIVGVSANPFNPLNECSEKQKKYLFALGYQGNVEKLNKTEASKLIDEYKNKKSSSIGPQSYANAAEYFKPKSSVSSIDPSYRHTPLDDMAWGGSEEL